MEFIEQKFNLKEFEMIDHIVYSAISSSGLGSWSWGENAEKIQLKTNPYQIIKDRFLGFRVDDKINAPKHIWIEFLFVFKEARAALGESEMQTITGYEWEETVMLENKIQETISK